MLGNDGAFFPVVSSGRSIPHLWGPASDEVRQTMWAQMGQMLRDDGERWGKVIAALGGLALD